VVTRTRLLRRLIERGAGPLVQSGAGRLVAIVAPAGYGKTTLLAQWRALERRPVAWLTLDRADADPAALLVGLTTAIDAAITLEPGLARSVAVPTGAALTTGVSRRPAPGS
jgi:LuxR family maltose regulon positive regulatory protein